MLAIFLSHSSAGSPVPNKSLHATPAIFTPDAVQPVSKFPLDLSRTRKWEYGFDIIFTTFRRLINGSFSVSFYVATSLLTQVFTYVAYYHIVASTAAHTSLNPLLAKRIRRAFLHLSFSFITHFGNYSLPACCNTGRTMVS